MGGCCCCSSKGVERNSAPAYYYHGASSAHSTGLLVDTNLETSVPDAYRPPPAPIPFDACVGHPQTPPVTQEICRNKSDPSGQTTPDLAQETLGDNTHETSAKCDDLKEPECKTLMNVEIESAKELEVELSKSVQPAVAVIEEEDVCPTSGRVRCQRIQELSQNVSIIFTLHAFLNGWKEVKPVQCAIRK